MHKFLPWFLGRSETFCRHREKDISGSWWTYQKVDRYRILECSWDMKRKNSRNSGSKEGPCWDLWVNIVLFFLPGRWNLFGCFGIFFHRNNSFLGRCWSAPVLLRSSHWSWEGDGSGWILLMIVRQSRGDFLVATKFFRLFLCVFQMHLNLPVCEP